MGTWGCLPLENDNASDWLNELTDISTLTQAFVLVLQTNDYIELDSAEIALAGAEVIANLLNGVDITDEFLTVWKRMNKASQQSLVNQARHAVQKVLADSELKELWSESEDYSEWISSTNTLIEGLQVPGNLSKRKSNSNILRFKFKGDSHVFRVKSITELFMILYEENLRFTLEDERERFTPRAYIVDMINRCKLQDSINSATCSPEQLIECLLTKGLIVQVKA